MEAPESDGRAAFAGESKHVSADGVGHALALGPQAGVESHRAERTLGDEEMREGVHAAAADGGVGEAASDEASGVAADGVGDVGVIETEVDGLDDERAVYVRGGAALEKSLGVGVARERGGGFLAGGVGVVLRARPDVEVRVETRAGRQGSGIGANRGTHRAGDGRGAARGSTREGG